MDDESTQELNDEVGSDLEGVEEEEEESSDDSLSSDESGDDTGEDKGNEPDWKQLYEKEKEEKENYKTALDQKRQLRKKPKEEVVEDESEDIEEDEDEDDKPLTRAEYNERESLKTVDSTLAGLVQDPDKRKLVKLYYETRVRHTGTSDAAIKADIQTALDIADAKKLRKTVGEIGRVNGQDKTPPLNGSGSDRGSAAKGHKFSAEQVAALTESAKRIGANPEKFIQEAWKNQQGR